MAGAPFAPSPVPRLVVEGARAQVGRTVTYDGGYRRIPYPGGDLPIERGSCTDVVVRAYRNAGIDLQRLVHEDMRRSFEEYPHLWRVAGPDPSIDHRRVPNLATFFRRQGAALPITRDPADYAAGDVVVWAIPVPHIGIVSDVLSGNRPLVVHNIGQGTVLEDTLFAFPIKGHYRYDPGRKLRQRRM